MSIEWINYPRDKWFTVTAPVKIIFTNRAQLELKLIRHETDYVFTNKKTLLVGKMATYIWYSKTYHIWL